MSGLAAPADDVDVDGDEDHDDAGHDGLPLLRDRHDPQAVGERADDERADDRAEDRALAAAQRRAADDDRGDRLELVAQPERRLGGVQPRAAIRTPAMPANMPAERVDGSSTRRC